MKKITVMILCLFGTLLYGQVNIQEDFNSGTPAGWTDSYANSSELPCEGSSERDNLFSSSATGNLTSPNLVAASNGTDLTVSFDYKIVDYDSSTFGASNDPTPAGWGTAEVQYSTDDGANWTTVFTIDDSNHVAAATCATVMTTVPAASLPSGADVKLRINNTWADGDYFFYVDNFSAAQVVSTPPNCDSVLISTTDVSIVGDISWSMATGVPDAYDLTVGTTSGGSEVLVTTDVGNVTSFNLGLLEFSTTYYVTIVPKNANGSATGCTEQTFVTESDPAVTVDCASGTPVNTTFCYGNNEDLQFPFVSSDGGTLRISFIEGYFEACCDDIIIYDGATTSDTILFQSDGSEGDDATGIEATSTGDRILVRLVSDGSVNCSIGSGSPDLSFDVACTTTETADFNNLQFPPTITVEQGNSEAVFARVFEAGVTEPAGQGAGIESWIGISDTDATTTADFASGWTWIPATYNVDAGNDDEYMAMIGDNLMPGSYFYVSRFRVSNGPFTYGGINAGVGSGGNFWDGTTFVSGQLTVTAPPPPPNDECADAIALTVNSDFSCAVVTPGTIEFATDSGADDATCFGTPDDDVWYSFVATATAHRVSLINITGSTTDMYMTFYDATGGCGSLGASIACSDPQTANLSGLTIGTEYFLQVYTWTPNPGQTSAFDVCVGTPPPPPANDLCSGSISLPIDGTVVNGTTIGATGAGGATTCDGTIGNDVWYVLTGDGGDITVEVVAASVGAQIGIYESTDGTCAGFTEGTCIASVDDLGMLTTDVTFASAIGTTYYVNIGAFSSSSSDFDFTVTATSSTLSVVNIDNPLGFSYYPNPVDNQLTLNASTNNIEQVTMFNMLGQQVMDVRPNALSSDLDMSGLQTGTYFVKVTIANVTETIRIVKE